MPVPTLTPAPAKLYDTSYGGVPQVPAPAASAGAALSGNISNLAQLYNLAGNVNAFQTGQARAPLIAGLPNYENMLAQSSGNIGSLLKGQIPADVLSQIEQGAAERGIATGSAGSPNANAAMLRALGLTSLGLQTQGEQELTAAIGRTPQPPLMNPATFLVGPEQQQQAEMAANVYGAAPSPADAAAAAMGAARAGARAGGGGVSYPGIGRTSGIGPLQQTPLGAPSWPTMVAGPGATSTGTYAPNPANTWAARTGSSIADYGGITGGGPTMNEMVSEGSQTWNDLYDMGIDPSGWNRGDAAAILGMSPEDLDLGAPAGSTDYAGSYDSFWSDWANELGV